MSVQRVYFANCIAANGAEMGAIKIGSSWGVPRRLDSLTALVPFDCELLADAPGGMFHEYAVHMWFRADRISGEYFRPSGELLAFIDRVRARGRLPLRISGSDMDQGPWVSMAGARSFMERHSVTVEDIAAVSGSRVKSCEHHLNTADRPNRKFAAALTVAALRKSHRIWWPRDFNVNSAHKIKEAA